MLIKNKFPYPEENVYLAITGTNIEYIKKFYTSGEIFFTPKIIVSSSERCIREQIEHRLNESEKLYTLLNIKDLKSWFYDYKGSDIIELSDTGTSWYISFNMEGKTHNQVCFSKSLEKVVEYCSDELNCIPHCIFTEKELSKIIQEMTALASGENLKIPYIFIENYYSNKKEEVLTEITTCLYKRLDYKTKQVVDKIFNKIMKD